MNEDFIEVDGREYVSMDRYQELGAYCQRLKSQNQELEDRIEFMTGMSKEVLQHLDDVNTGIARVGELYQSDIEKINDRIKRQLEVFIESHRLSEEAETIFARVTKIPVSGASGYIYVLKDIDVTGYYKIGMTRNPKRRFTHFGVNLPFRCDLIHLGRVENVYSAEAKLHAMFADKRIRPDAEWFKLEPRDIGRIKRIKV